MANKNSPKRIASNNRWTNAHYDRVNLALPLGTKKRIKGAAQAGESVNAYCTRAIARQLTEDERGETDGQDRVQYQRGAVPEDGGAV